MAAEPPERKRNVPDDERKHRDTYKELVSKLNVDNDAERAEARAAMLQFIHQADIGLYYPVVIHIYHTFGLDEDRKKSVYDWTPETFSRIRGRLETSMKMLVQAMPYYESGFYEVSEFKSMVEFYQCEIARLNLLENVVKKEAAYQKVAALNNFFRDPVANIDTRHAHRVPTKITKLDSAAYTPTCKISHAKTPNSKRASSLRDSRRNTSPEPTCN